MTEETPAQNIRRKKMRTTAITGTAGEHYVAYRLARMGYLPALTRGGSPSVDILVANQTGTGTLGIQVKTSTWAWYQYKRDKQKPNFWNWDVNPKATTLKGDRLFYAFVDLRDDPKDHQEPVVFIVPSKDVTELVKKKHTRKMFWIYEADEQKYKERWDYIEAVLKQN